MDDDYAVAFELIAHAGSSRSHSMSALQLARGNDFAAARSELDLAEVDLRAAHGTQTSLVQREAAGDRVPVNVILIHAQDHLSSAIVVRELAEEMLALHERIARIDARAEA
jgi:cellobiose PTS system EIIA component